MCAAAAEPSFTPQASSFSLRQEAAAHSLATAPYSTLTYCVPYSRCVVPTGYRFAVWQAVEAGLEKEVRVRDGGWAATMAIREDAVARAAAEATRRLMTTAATSPLGIAAEWHASAPIGPVARSPPLHGARPALTALRDLCALVRPLDREITGWRQKAAAQQRPTSTLAVVDQFLNGNVAPSFIVDLD